MTAVRPAADDQRAAVVAGFLGWTLDAFDFFLVVMTLTAIAREFGKSDAAIALSITLTLAFRPVGAFIFGLIADRYGRKLPLRSEEHTSELQSRFDLVCRLLLEKKKDAVAQPHPPV